MSILTTAIGLAKKAKHALKDEIDKRTPVYLSPVRRIERVKTNQRVCAMTFDDGPMALPSSPDNHQGKPLTLVLLETLERHNAKGTFDIVGDTSGNYPDTAGKHGSATWGGIAYDHYPDIDKDHFGGAVNCPQLVERILEGGHQITNHTYSHVLFGKKPLVYGGRKHMDSLDEVVYDLSRLDDLLYNRYDYKMKFMRPPHYVDKIRGRFSSYDACAVMDYQYLAASFDGAGWLPCKTYEEEVEATWKPIEAALAKDPDALCGQIIFQKDGYNMARRTPIADGLEKALEILDSYGYKVVTVEELMNYSPFEDIGIDDPIFDAAYWLLDHDYTIVYRNNKLLLDAPLTRGELAMMIFGNSSVDRRIDIIKGNRRFRISDVDPVHPYSGAIDLAIENGGMRTIAGRFSPNNVLNAANFQAICRNIYGRTPDISGPVTHRTAIEVLAKMEGIE
ncbi:MAG: polysaccharide deacetylase family protein [Clostridia bacterium]|nr:polysaccharide deacetylase family protein [Clostridia bacterium]